MRTIIIN